MLVKCRECATDVSSKAKSCPNCGISNPTRSNAGYIIGCLALIAFFVAIAGPRKASTDQAQQISSEAENAKWLNENGDNPFALDKRYSNAAQSSCSAGVDSYLREIANYDFAWDAETDNWGIKFDKISNSSAGHGLLTLVSTMAKLSNQFGAFNHIRVFCLYDTQSDSVIRYSLGDPSVDIGNDEKEFQKNSFDYPDKSISKNQDNGTIVIYNADAASIDRTELQNNQ